MKSMVSPPAENLLVPSFISFIESVAAAISVSFSVPMSDIFITASFLLLQSYDRAIFYDYITRSGALL